MVVLYHDLFTFCMKHEVSFSITLHESYPAGTWRKNDIILMSMRRDDIASKLIQRHFGTTCPLGIKNVHNHDLFTFKYKISYISPYNVSLSIS